MNGPDIGAYESQGPPDAPTNLSATVSSPDEIGLSWSDDSDNVDGYSVWISTNGTSFTEIPGAPDDGFTYWAMHLTPDTTYTFEVKAESIDGESAASSPVSATAISSTLAATGAATVSESGSYSLSFSSTPSDGLSWPIDHWLINWNDGTGGSTDDIDTVSGASGSDSHTFPSGTASADVTITAVDTQGNTFTLPDQFINVVPTTPSTPTVTVMSENEIDLSWTDDSAIETGYTILRSDDGGATYDAIGYTDPGTTTYDDTTTDPDTSYQYEVQANNDDDSGGDTGDSSGDSSGDDSDNNDSSTSSGSASTTTPSGTPGISVVAGPTGSGTAVITWTYQGNDDSGFELEEEDQGSGGNYQLITTFGSVDSSGEGSYTVPGLTFDDTYLFRIRADHSDGTVSGYSGGQVTPTGLTAPMMNASPQAPYGENQIELDWDPAVNSSGQTAISYTVEWISSWATGQAWTPIENAYSGMVWAMDSNGMSAQFRIQAQFADGTTTEWGYSSTVEGGNTPVVGVAPDPVSDTEIDVSFSINPQDSTGDIGYGVEYAPYDAPGGYDLAVSTADLPPLAVGDTGTVQVTGLTPGTRYNFVVEANWHGDGTSQADDGGFGIGSADATTQGTATALPAAPSGLTATPTVENGQAGISLRWYNSPNNETGFTIERSTTPDFDDNVQIFTVGADAPTFFNGVGPGGYSVQPGVTYYYRVGSTNAATTNTGPVYGFETSAAVVYTAKNMHALGIDTEAASLGASPGSHDAALEVQAGMDLAKAASECGTLLSDAYKLAQVAQAATKNVARAVVQEAADILTSKLADMSIAKAAGTPEATQLQNQAIGLGNILNNAAMQSVGVYIWVKVQGDIYVNGKLLYKNRVLWIQVNNGNYNNSDAYDPAGITGAVVAEAIDLAENTFFAARVQELDGQGISGN